MHNRRTIIAMLASALPLAPALAASAPAPKAKKKPAAAAPGARKPITTDDMTMGNPKAPVTVVEYASVACPICAAFNNEVFDDFKKKYIDTGKVYFIYREMIAHNPALAVAGYLVARCAGQDKYFQVTDAIYHARDDMEASGKYREGLLKIAQDAGLTEAEFDACTSDQAQVDAMSVRVQKNMAIDDVTGTPTFVINGAKVGGYKTLEDLDALIAAAKPAPKAKPKAAAKR